MIDSYKPKYGAYPTMITPYNEDGTVDYGAVKALTEWYWQQGCDGIFASCQSSEIHLLSLEDRVKLAKVVKETADALALSDKSRPPMTVVASGHISDSFDDQVDELTKIAETGVEAVILISNRLDIANTSDEAWCADLDRLIAALPDVPLGIYECPRPYKRLLTPAMIDHVVRTGRFAFIKDTCCDSDEIDRRVKQIEATPTDGIKPALFNANAQTLLETLRSGGAGYCGVMCNFHPSLYVWLCKNFDKQPEKAELLAAFLCQAAFIEFLTYPAIAKYHLNKIGVSMTTISRTCDVSKMKRYDRLCVDRMDKLAEHFGGLL
ncbi:MAG: dihydrodipicolinate synthase family protein [Clostridia bacterium]|nr:dihydrodipicolinate synthase family protein [Clostridia bacterium]